MVDMAKDAKQVENTMAVPMEQPIYPYGLSICLTNEELDKLELEADCEIGDLLHIVCMAKVTSVSKNETTEGESCRIELQIIDIETMENESEEYKPAIRPSKFYNV